MEGTIHLRGNSGPRPPISDSSVTITRQTQIEDRTGTASRPLSFASLRIGQTVEVWLTGPVAQSFPVQGTASRVVIIGEPGVGQ
ncbi:MAG: YobA family protein [Armatimonadetes bacterium]|nr:YobA family protein [Armatimonadota bacterium]